MPPTRQSDQPDQADQAGEFLATAQGLRLPETDHSLKASDRGPTLLEDFHLGKKITHFDHERIPEWAVHARGAAAHSVFGSYGTASSVTKAGYLGEGVRTDVFCCFSSVLGSRLDGPNFAQLSINRPHCPVNDMLRDGMYQTAVQTGLAPYRPNGIDGGEPLVAGADEHGYVQSPAPVEGVKVRANPVSFDDRFSQATVFYRSLTELEQVQIVEAFTFELGKCHAQAIKERELQVLAYVDTDLCEQVAAGPGLPAPAGEPAADVPFSAALSQIVVEPGLIAGRRIGVIADAEADQACIAALRKAMAKHGATVHVIAPVGGKLTRAKRTQIVERTLLTVRSIEFDALVVAGGTTPSVDLKLALLLQEAYRHFKALAARGDAAIILAESGIPDDASGVRIAARSDKTFGDSLVAAVGPHRAWDRAALLMASAAPPARPASTNQPESKES